MELLRPVAVVLVEILLFFFTVDAGLPTSHDGRENEATRICVPDMFLESCEQMVQDARNHSIPVSCIAARDRLNCLEKISGGAADFVQLDPEDLYLALSFKEGLKVIKDIRTNDKAAERFRSKNVAVVRKNLRLSKISDLRGRKSCHTGISRNAGLVIAKLAQLGVLDQIHNIDLSSRENEMRSMSEFFSQACLVGVRSADPEQNDRLKTAYPNLCELCDDPAKCDYPDNFADADGALRCLTEKGGDVAWTKVAEVDKHFGIGSRRPVGRGNVTDYMYLCPDASKRPLGSLDECRWGARPWEVFVTGAPDSAVPKIRSVIGKLNVIGSSVKANWLTTLMAVNDVSSAVDNERPVSPKEYLDIAEYRGVVGRNFGAEAPIRFCVVSVNEVTKCRGLAISAYSRAIRPMFGCAVRMASPVECMKAIRDANADVMMLDPGDVVRAKNEFNLKPILSEKYGNDENLYYSVAVVKRFSKLRSLEDLRGTRSCHTGFGDATGWNLPLNALLNKNLISKTTCPYSKGMAEFFSGGSCVPGASATSNNIPQRPNPASLCSLCVGNQNATSPVAQRRSKCIQNRNEEFFGEDGAFLCMTSGAGDVAFLRHTTVQENTDGKNLEYWAARLLSENYELICPNGTRAPVGEYKTCNLGQVPARYLVTNGAKTAHEVGVIRDAVFAAGALYSRRQDLFRMFGPYNGEKDVLFKDSTKGFLTVSEVSEAHVKYANILKDIQACSPPPVKWNWNKDSIPL